MKIYTKRGDDGMTDLFGGARVAKSHLQVKAYGAIDAANSAIGLASSVECGSLLLRKELTELMKWLFCAGAEVACAPKKSAEELLKKNLSNQIEQTHIEKIEKLIDELESNLDPLKSFILPSGSDMAARLHFARNMVRQAEIALVELIDSGHYLRKEILHFFNRLSDLLFVMARFANKEAGISDELWSGRLTD